MPPSKNDDNYYNLKLDVAVINKEIENIKDDVEDIKEEISGIKGWAVKAFWVVLTAILIQATNFVLSGGLNGIIK